MEDLPSKLNDLSEKSAQKNGGSSAQYIQATLALRDDLISVMNLKFDSIHHELNIVKQELQSCKESLKASKEREIQLLKRLESFEGTQKRQSENVKEDFYLVGSSILRDVRDSDISNAKVKCIRGGCIDNVKADIKDLSFVPKTIITQIGGNDLDRADASVEQITSDYAVLFTEVKDKFPETNVIISGLPPRFKDDSIRTKVKDFNSSIQKWANENEIQYIDNEPLSGPRVIQLIF